MAARLIARVSQGGRQSSAAFNLTTARAQSSDEPDAGMQSTLQAFTDQPERAILTNAN
jgi:hypothetical protein